MILNDFIHVYRPRAGTDNPLGTKIFMSTEIPYHFAHLLPVKKNLFEVWYFTIFNVFFFHMNIAPDRGRQLIGDKHFMTTERPFLFAHMLQVLEWSLRNLYTFLMTLYLHIAPGQGKKLLGDKLLMSTESPYHFNHLLQVSNKSLWILTLYIFVNVFPHVYSPGAEANNPLWTKFWCQQKGLVTLPICCKFQTNLFEFWFYTFFNAFIHVYSPGAGADNHLGSEFLCKHIPHVTLVICCKFLPLNDFLTVFPI